MKRSYFRCFVIYSTLYLEIWIQKLFILMKHPRCFFIFIITTFEVNCNCTHFHEIKTNHNIKMFSLPM